MVKKQPGDSRIEFYVDLTLLAGMTVFLTVYFDIRLLLTDTVVTGGDTASWHAVADHLMEVLIPAGRLTGWDMGNFCGYPNFSFYFLPPFLLAVIPAKLFGISLAVALKWAIMSGIFLLPHTAYFGLRNLGYRFPAPILGAAAALLLVFNESYSMFGANALSTFAGEFCYMFAFALLLYFIGSLYRGCATESRLVFNGILLGLIGLSHLFVFIPALILMVYMFFAGVRVRYLLGVGLHAFGLMAFWILALVAYRHPYTTPVYMIWQEFVNPRYAAAGAFIVFVFIAPPVALGIMGEGDRRGRELGFVLLCTGGIAAGAYLALQYLALGGDLWATGLNLPDLSASPLGRAAARKIRLFAFPLAALTGLLSGVVMLAVRRSVPAAFKLVVRAAASVCFCICVISFLVVLNRFVARALPGRLPAVFLPGARPMSVIYMVLFGGLAAFLVFSRRFTGLLERAAAAGAFNRRRLYMWLTLVFGCLALYFCAHFLQVPDIRFLPPVIYSLGLIFCAETVGPLLSEKRTAVKAAAAFTAVYLAVVTVIFGAEKSEYWFRFNNRGYELTAGYQDFFSLNRYLRNAYRAEGPAPLEAPRVAYEKCDLYGPYGGDRAFESLPFFSGRQTLEGIHFAGSLASRSMAYLQTEFSRDIKSPTPQIFSKIDIEALPARFDLYNISQLIVMTDTVKRALATSPHFKKEADFGKISLYRYLRPGSGYVDVPEVRPVLYTGKNWPDAFYAWFRDPGRSDVLLVPDRRVIDEADRAVFSGRAASATALDAFRDKKLNRDGLKLETRLDHLRIRFKTNKIGLPHLIKVTYFPNWRVKGARGVYPVSPHLMMVVPREQEVILSYRRNIWEILGLIITCGWLAWVSGRAVYIRLPAVRSRRQGLAGNRNRRAAAAWEALERRLGRFRPLLMWLLIAGVLGLASAGAVLRNRPVRIYEAGYRAYQRGSRLLQEGEKPAAAKQLTRAIQVMRPLVEKRAAYDHRDVINSLLVTAMCHEKLKDFQAAEALYRALVREYPRSRYVGEGYVKLARIRKWRSDALWGPGMEALTRGDKEAGADWMAPWLALREESLAFYQAALRKEPFSVWADYAREDLASAVKELAVLEKQFLSLSDNLAPIEGLKRLRESYEGQQSR